MRSDRAIVATEHLELARRAVDRANAGEELTLAETGVLVGLSHEWVRRIETEMLIKLRVALAGYGGREVA